MGCIAGARRYWIQERLRPRQTNQGARSISSRAARQGGSREGRGPGMARRQIGVIPALPQLGAGESSSSSPLVLASSRRGVGLVWPRRGAKPGAPDERAEPPEPGSQGSVASQFPVANAPRHPVPAPPSDGDEPRPRGSRTPGARGVGWWWWWCRCRATPYLSGTLGNCEPPVSKQVSDRRSSGAGEVRGFHVKQNVKAHVAAAPVRHEAEMRRKKPSWVEVKKSWAGG